VRVAVAGIPGAWSTEHMADALRARGVDSFTFSPGDLVHDLTTGRVTLAGADLSSLDGIVVKKLARQDSAWGRLRLHALRALEQAAVRVFSRADVIDRAMDRYRMTMELAAAGLPMPVTISAESADGLSEAAAGLGDAVVKPIYTSKGRGMVRFRGGAPANGDEALDADAQRYLVQQFVHAPGRDIGATVIGGRFVGAFYRVAAEGEWMTTTNQGGRYAPCELSSSGIELAERAARVFGLDYTVVDLVEHEGGFMMYEVSAFGGFRGLLDASGIDPAPAYAEHIIRELTG